MANELVIISGTAHPVMGARIAECLQTSLLNVEIDRFSDGEINIKILENIRGTDVFIIQPTMPPAENMLELLTPICKAYPSDMGFRVTEWAIQCFGGYGYCEDFPVGQHFRDVRIHPIHEGTTGIQGMDLLGRKVIMQNGRAFLLYIDELQDTMAAAGDYKDLEKFAGQRDSGIFP